MGEVSERGDVSRHIEQSQNEMRVRKTISCLMLLDLKSPQGRRGMAGKATKGQISERLARSLTIFIL